MISDPACDAEAVRVDSLGWRMSPTWKCSMPHAVASRVLQRKGVRAAVEGVRAGRATTKGVRAGRVTTKGVRAGRGTTKGVRAGRVTTKGVRAGRATDKGEGGEGDN